MMQHALRIKHYTLLEPQYEYLYSEVISWCKATRVVTATALVVDISLEDRLTKYLVAFLEPRYEAKSESLQYYSPSLVPRPSIPRPFGKLEREKWKEGLVNGLTTS